MGEIKTVEDIINENSCYFCRETQNVTIDRSNKKILSYNCPYCGHYQITREVIYNLQLGIKFRSLATSIAQEKKLLGEDGYVLQWRDIPEIDDEYKVCIGDVPFLNNYPKDYFEKLDRILVNIGKISNYSLIKKLLPDNHYWGLYFVDPINTYYTCDNVKNEYDTFGDIFNSILNIFEIFNDLGWVRAEKTAPNIRGVIFYLSVGGLKHIKELHNIAQEKSQAFVAMWFTDKEEYGKKLKKYVDSIRDAVNNTGYNLYIANQEKYNGAIMNRVINQIKESRFLIADLTCDRVDGMRGGVYYEAGFAAGLGMPVILTCNKEAHLQGLVHFDLKQFNTILWYIDENGIIRADGHPEEDFSEYMIDWIKATVGKKK